MTTHRELLAKALEALKSIPEAHECLHEETERLGVIWTRCQQCGRKWTDQDGPPKHRHAGVASVIEEIRAELAKPEPVPVAWRTWIKDAPEHWIVTDDYPCNKTADSNIEVQALFASPPPFSEISRAIVGAERLRMVIRQIKEWQKTYPHKTNSLSVLIEDNLRGTEEENL